LLKFIPPPLRFQQDIVEMGIVYRKMARLVIFVFLIAELVCNLERRNATQASVQMAECGNYTAPQVVMLFPELVGIIIPVPGLRITVMNMGEMIGVLRG